MTSRGVLPEANVVTVRIDGAHSKMPEYPLLPGDVLFKRDNGTWGKFAPGLGIEGFNLTEEQEATLEIKHNIAYELGN